MRARRTKQQPTVYYIPSSSSRRQKHLSEMRPEEITSWIHGTREHLERKKARERAYVDRRTARGTHTPTDEAYEQDQLLLDDLLWLLNEMEAGVYLWNKP